jgi:hypothetical protein
MLAALESSVLRAAAHGEPADATLHAVQALMVFAQGLAGDYSHGVWPDHDMHNGHEKADIRLSRAYLLLLIKIIQKFAPMSKSEAIATATTQLDEGVSIATDGQVRLWTVLSHESLATFKRKKGLGVHRTRTDKEKMQDLQDKIATWVDRPKRALPCESQAGTLLAKLTTVFDTLHSMSQEFYDTFHNDTLAHLLRSSPEAQEAMRECRAADTVKPWQ